MFFVAENKGEIIAAKTFKIISAEGTAMDKEFGESEQIIFSSNFDFTVLKFTRRIAEQDPTPIMPRMASVQARLCSLKEIPEMRDDQKEVIAGMGLYYGGKFKVADLPRGKIKFFMSITLIFSVM